MTGIPRSNHRHTRTRRVVRNAAAVLAAAVLMAGCGGTYRAAMRGYAADRPAPARTVTAPPPGHAPAPRIRPARAAVAEVRPFIDRQRLSGEEPDRLVRLLLAENPAIAAARDKAAAALATYGQERLIADTLARFQAFTAAQSQAGLPLPRAASLRERLVTLEVRQRRLGREKTIAANTVRLLTLYHGLARNRADRENAGQTLELFRGLKKAILARYSAGRASYRDLATAEEREERAAKRLRDLEEEEKSLRAGMNALARGSDARLAFTAPLPALPGPDALARLAAKDGIEVRLAETRLARVQAMLDLARATAAPDFSAGLSLRKGSDADGAFGEDIPAPGRPLAAFKPAGLAYLVRLEGERDAAAKALADARRRAGAGARRLWSEADAAARQAALLAEKIIPLDRSALETASRAFTAGAAGFAEVVRAADRLFAAKSELAAARAAFGRKYAELAEITGHYPLEVSP